MMLDTATDAAFLRTILANPDDDAPRLIYADWLDEQGDSDRAEFIRLQIRLARMCPDDKDFRDLVLRVEELRRAHHIEWVRQLPAFEKVNWEVFHRGFITAAKFDHPDAYFAHAREVFASAPIQELRLHQFYPAEATQLAGSRYLRRVRVLDLGDGNRIGNMGLEPLMNSPHLGNLSSLNLRGNSLGSAGVRAIAHSTYVRHLRQLRLDRNDLFDDGLIHLAGSPAMTGLVKLDLNRTRTGDDGIKAFSRSKHLTQLEWLDLSYNNLTDAAVTALAGSNVLGEVRDLFLHGNQITDAGVAALAASPRLACVERLFLRQNRIKDEGALALARSPHFGQLRELYLGGNNISDLAGDQLLSRFRSRVNLH